MIDYPSDTKADRETGSALLVRISEFGRYLANRGVSVRPGQIMNLLAALDQVGLDREDFRLAARTLLVTRHDDLPIFDKAFEEYWKGRFHTSLGGEDAECVNDSSTDDTDICPERDRESDASIGTADASESTLELAGMRLEDAPDEDSDDVQQLPLYSAIELLRRKDFARFTPEEIALARRAFRDISWEIGSRLSRRSRSSARGEYPNIRRAFRSTLRHGELLDLGRRARREKPRQLVVLCDVSGSMDCYSRLFLHFLHTMEQGAYPTEVFVFGTRLTRITRQLANKDVDNALQSVSAEVLDWAGGTCIGESLRAFNTQWARRVLRNGAVVLIISDGWDRGDTDLLSTEIAKLQRGCHQLIWLNPLLGSPNYQPLTKGIRAALPYVDRFLPIHNLDSFVRLADLLSQIGADRPIRKQRPTQRAAV